MSLTERYTPGHDGEAPAWQPADEAVTVGVAELLGTSVDRLDQSPVPSHRLVYAARPGSLEWHLALTMAQWSHRLLTGARRPLLCSLRLSCPLTGQLSPRPRQPIHLCQPLHQYCEHFTTTVTGETYTSTGDKVLQGERSTPQPATTSHGRGDLCGGPRRRTHNRRYHRHTHTHRARNRTAAKRRLGGHSSFDMMVIER